MFVYYPPQDNFVLFGGARERQKYADDMWVWKSGAWRRLEGGAPPARGFAAAAYNAETETIVMHGGRGNDGVTYSDLWEWNGEHWRLIDASSPLKSDHHQMAYLPSRKGVLIFGGWTGDGVTDASWLWDGAWEELAENSDRPPPRSAFGMTYNEQKERVELFGGLWINGQYADAWAWRKDSWFPLSGPHENSSLDHHTMFFDPALGKSVIFGGKDYRYRMRGETRALADEGGVELLTGDGPSARHSTAIAVDGVSNRAILFGGKEYQDEEQKPLGDMWVWQAGAWRRVDGE